MFQVRSQDPKPNYVSTLIGMMLGLCVFMATAWLGQVLLTVLTVIVGFVVGLVTWIFTDFETGLYSGFCACVASWIVLRLLRALIEVGLGSLAGRQSSENA